MHRVTQQQHVRAAWPWTLGALVLAAVIVVVLWVVHPRSPACPPAPTAAGDRAGTVADARAGRSASTAVGPGPSASIASASEPNGSPAADRPAPIATAAPPSVSAAPASGTTAAPNAPAPQPLPLVERRDPPREGQARYYTFDRNVACSFPDLPMDGYYVGVPSDEYAGGAACGEYLDIEGPLGSVRAVVVDRCPGCAPGRYDLSTAAFTRVADQGDGVAPIRVSRVHDPVPPPELTYRVQNGSSGAWLALVFADTGNPLSHVEIRPHASGPDRSLTRGPDNSWAVSGAGPGPFTALITDTEGHQLRIPDIVITPGPTQRTGLRLYDPTPPPPPTSPTTSPPPVPAPTSALASCP
ncbi:expansin EXLX1 family cellulose-binding protein [Nocardia sp. NPDC004068]|uniref:expansin EXLX1 family cellulose-binding protein n=1 Tax=Nocardia sp. NPDC004068 TaxID=3364303 RepID=UPI0036774DBE